jgi:DNA-binding beta-propeller fold protein YncE
VFRIPVGLTLLVLGGLALSATGASAATAPTINVGSNPNAVVISSSQNRAYVANDGSVSVVNLNTHQQTAEISTTVNHGQTAIGLFRGGSKAYIGDFGLNTMVAFNTSTQAVTPGIKVGFGVTDIAGASNGLAYFSQFRAQGAKGSLAIVRTSTDKLTKTIQLAFGAGTLTTAPGSRRIWIGSVINGRIWVIDTHTNRIVRRLMASKSGPVTGIAFTSDRKQAWVMGLGGLSVINRATGKLDGFVPTTKVYPPNPPFTPGPVVMNQDSTEALVLNTAVGLSTPGPGSVVAINTTTLRRTSSRRLGTEPTAFAIDPTDNTVVATNYLDDTLSYFTAPK